MSALKRATTNPHQNPTETNPLTSLLQSFTAYRSEPTPESYHFLLKTLAQSSQFHHIPPVLDHLEKNEKFETPEFVFSGLLESYANANDLKGALELFFRIPKFRCVPSVYLLNSLLKLLCRSREGLELVPGLLLRSRDLNIRLEGSTFDVLIAALCRLKRIGYAIELMNYMVNDGFDVNTKICSLLLSSLCKQRGVDSAQVMSFVEGMRKFGFCPGLVDYRNVIRFLVKAKMGRDALGVLSQMKSDGIKPDTICYTLVLDGIIEMGDFSKADELFDELLGFGLIPDVCTYNVYINGLCKQNKIEAGIEMVASMEELGCKPNLAIYSLLVEGFCRTGDVSKAVDLVREMESKKIGLNGETCRIMIDGLVKEDKIAEACALLEEILDKGFPAGSLSFDVLICQLCQKGQFSKALELVEKMVDKHVSPGSRVWEALLLTSDSKFSFVEPIFTSLVDTNKHQPS
ncbi:hypothetical protein Tsubulata_045228 [Turnera subulata]|uniref:Pentacotripeptide-repeat region of PRORP domain-containing protein n=1 Tax=Turnera subulata TaxID=218843 RepID=A0A9Q0JPS0_9ROSI|nr:hypothetical protein Tsubulata_045228 [Turnera subulata]